MTYRSILLAATSAAAVVFAVSSAHAQMLGQVPGAVTGPYVDLGLGTSLMQSQRYTVAPKAMGETGTMIFRPSYAGQVGVGYGLGNGFRVELDGNFFRNTAVKANDHLFGDAHVHGGVNTYGLLLNGYYDFQTGTNFMPFIGGGIGYMWQKFQHVGLPAPDSQVGGTYGSFAFDVGAGVAYNITSVPGLALTAQYQYIELTHARKYNDYGTVVNMGHSGNHEILLGVRYELFPPAPPPPPAPVPVAAPAPAPARTYLVFFNWDKANLTPRATQIVAEAAHASQTTHVTRLNVNGYTDTSGTPAYNMKLSYRRADNVAAQLVSDGVPKQDIMIKGYGETHLLVPTGPGVREPQNRRVEIILH
ncbi:OmpA family protein [Acidiphilium sp. AL]|uniref:OmpA family protein n=1 Tax=Acidiphilium iwatense TaxID=768198 RepID=A0ABS9DYI2_9PROT|nr:MULTISPECIES: OmpA family protein [Acidiphilium]MCF3947739.1 OmpA family protein [Acidiphilium iwatense]MCU4160094.1 OmpA family protein [Acidiphilium sp. AL]